VCSTSSAVASAIAVAPYCDVLQVDLWLGDALRKLPEVSAAKGRSIDLLLLDGLPKETLQYLQAAEPYLAPGAMIVADNAGKALRCRLVVSFMAPPPH
jgi:predicted O-methyltransferase YrrM